MGSILLILRNIFITYIIDSWMFHNIYGERVYVICYPFHLKSRSHRQSHLFLSIVESDFQMAIRSKIRLVYSRVHLSVGKVPSVLYHTD